MTLRVRQTPRRWDTKYGAKMHKLIGPCFDGSPSPSTTTYWVCFCDGWVCCRHSGDFNAMRQRADALEAEQRSKHRVVKYSVGPHALKAGPGPAGDVQTVGEQGADQSPQPGPPTSSGDPAPAFTLLDVAKVT